MFVAVVDHDVHRPPGDEAVGGVVDDVERLDVPRVAHLQPLGDVLDDAEERHEAERQEQHSRARGRRSSCSSAPRRAASGPRRAASPRPRSRGRGTSTSRASSASDPIPGCAAAASVATPVEGEEDHRPPRQRPFVGASARRDRCSARRRWRSSAGHLGAVFAAVLLSRPSLLSHAPRAVRVNSLVGGYDGRSRSTSPVRGTTPSGLIPGTRELHWPRCGSALRSSWRGSPAALSRLARRGGGTTIPGQASRRRSTRARWTRSPPGSPRDRALVSATNGKTTTAAMAAEILRPRARLAHNRAGANLLSGVASALVAGEDAELGLFEVDEAAFPEVARRTTAARARAREPLPRPARPLRRARDRRGALARRAGRARSGRDGRRERRRPAARRSRALPGRARCASASTIRPSRATASRTPPTRSTASAAGRPTRTPATYVGHLGAYRCPNGDDERPPLDVDRARDRAGRARRRLVRPRHPGRRRAASNRAPRPL